MSNNNYKIWAEWKSSDDISSNFKEKAPDGKPVTFLYINDRSPYMVSVAYKNKIWSVWDTYYYTIDGEKVHK